MVTKFKDGGIVPPLKEGEPLPVLITSPPDFYMNKDQFFRLGKLLGKTDEELNKEWEKLPVLELRGV